MKRLVLGAVIMMIVVVPAAAKKMGPSWRSDASSDPRPMEEGGPIPVCHLVKERIATRHGHAVYQTRQVCG
jgi:hypothetical protein